MFALSMALLIFGLIAVALDLSQLYEARVRLYDAAEQAALTGASDVLVCPAQDIVCGNGTAQAGGPPPLAPGAGSLCEATGDGLTGAAGTTSCSVAGDAVVADVAAQVSVIIPIPGMGGSFTVRASYQAAPVMGDLRPVA